MPFSFSLCAPFHSLMLTFFAIALSRCCLFLDFRRLLAASAQLSLAPARKMICGVHARACWAYAIATSPPAASLHRHFALAQPALLWVDTGAVAHWLRLFAIMRRRPARFITTYSQRFSPEMLAQHARAIFLAAIFWRHEIPPAIFAATYCMTPAPARLHICAWARHYSFLMFCAQILLLSIRARDSSMLYIAFARGHYSFMPIEECMLRLLFLRFYWRARHIRSLRLIIFMPFHRDISFFFISSRHYIWRYAYGAHGLLSICHFIIASFIFAIITLLPLYLYFSSRAMLVEHSDIFFAVDICMLFDISTRFSMPSIIAIYLKIWCKHFLSFPFIRLMLFALIFSADFIFFAALPPRLRHGIAPPRLSSFAVDHAAQHSSVLRRRGAWVACSVRRHAAERASRACFMITFCWYFSDIDFRFHRPTFHSFSLRSSYYFTYTSIVSQIHRLHGSFQFFPLLISFSFSVITLHGFSFMPYILLFHCYAFLFI